MANIEKLIWPGSTQLAPVPPVLVGCGGGQLPNNLFTVAWTGIACSRPPLITIAVRPERYSYGLIRASGEFTVNLPTAPLARAVDFCGVRSGRDLDKFAACRLTPLSGSAVSAPLVAECPLSLECRVEQTLELGSHTLFLARILAIQVNADWVDASGRLNLERDGLLAYAHGHYYGLGACLGHFGFSVRRKASAASRRRETRPSTSK